MSFNSSQITAINHVNGPMLVLAGPGSGKTTVITHRVKNLVKNEGVNPSNILVITFTKAAAKEMENRYLSISDSNEQRVTFGTFHAIFFRILKYAYNYNVNNIVREEMQYDIIREVIYKNGYEINDEAEYIQNALNEISIVKNERIPIDSYYSINFSSDEFKSIYNYYTNVLESRRLIDFDDMMVYCYELFDKRPDILAGWQKKYQYILIDEFQDINHLQYEIIKMLAKPNNNLFIVGDDDQSIYGFRGAKPQIMLGFPKDYSDAKTVILDVNYRSTSEIINASKNLISYNKERFVKEIVTHNDNGASVEYHHFKTLKEENDTILKILSESASKGESISDFAIITRTNDQPGGLVHKLIEYNVPFVAKENLPNIFDHWIAKDIFSYINIGLGSDSREDYLRIINRPNRYFHRAAFSKNPIDMEDIYKFYSDKEYMQRRIEDFEDELNMIKNLSPFSAVSFIANGIGYEDYLKEYAEYRHINFDDLVDILSQIKDSAKGFKTFDDWYESIKNFKEKLVLQREKLKGQDSIGVNILTMHGAKGLEFKNVIIPDLNEELIPHKKAVLDAEIEEERRMLYVAMTRAKEKLYIMSVENRYNKEYKPSRFISEIKNAAT